MALWRIVSKAFLKSTKTRPEIESPLYRLLHYHSQGVDVVGTGSERSEPCLFVAHISFNGTSYSRVYDFGQQLTAVTEQCYASPVITNG